MVAWLLVLIAVGWEGVDSSALAVAGSLVEVVVVLVEFVVVVAE